MRLTGEKGTSLTVSKESVGEKLKKKPGEVLTYTLAPRTQCALLSVKNVGRAGSIVDGLPAAWDARGPGSPSQLYCQFQLLNSTHHRRQQATAQGLE